MIRNHDSLVARVFRVRYFKDGNIFVKSNASFIGRSLVWSRPLIAKGLMWRIGNGESVGAFQDKWIVGLKEKLSVDSKNGANHDMKVSELIDQEGKWNDERLEALLQPFEIEAVRNTPIGEHGTRDELFWKHDVKGDFTVKTAYLAEIGFYDENPTSSNLDRKFWSKRV